MRKASFTDFVPHKENITSDCNSGECEDVRLHDGSIMRIHKIEDDYDSKNAIKAITAIEHHKQKSEILDRVQQMVDPQIPISPNYLTSGLEGISNWRFHEVKCNY